MKLRSLAFTCALSLTTAAIAQPANACGRGGLYGGLEALAYVAAAVGVVFVATDLGFGIYDVSKAAKHERVSDGYATAEIIVMLPQSLVFYSLGADEKGDRETFWTFGLVPTAMLVHGVASLSTKKSEGEVVSKSGAPLSTSHGPSLAWTLAF
jgi:hypothetical protein